MSNSKLIKKNTLVGDSESKSCFRRLPGKLFQLLKTKKISFARGEERRRLYIELLSSKGRGADSFHNSQWDEFRALPEPNRRVLESTYAGDTYTPPLVQILMLCGDDELKLHFNYKMKDSFRKSAGNWGIFPIRKDDNIFYICSSLLWPGLTEADVQAFYETNYRVQRRAPEVPMSDTERASWQARDAEQRLQIAALQAEVARLRQLLGVADGGLAVSDGGLQPGAASVPDAEHPPRFGDGPAHCDGNDGGGFVVLDQGSVAAEGSPSKGEHAWPPGLGDAGFSKGDGAGCHIGYYGGPDDNDDVEALLQLEEQPPHSGDGAARCDGGDSRGDVVLDQGSVASEGPSSTKVPRGDGAGCHIGGYGSPDDDGLFDALLLHLTAC